MVNEERLARLLIKMASLAETLPQSNPNMVPNTELYIAVKREGQGTGWSYVATGLSMDDLECARVLVRDFDLSLPENG